MVVNSAMQLLLVVFSTALLFSMKTDSCSNNEKPTTTSTPNSGSESSPTSTESQCIELQNFYSESTLLADCSPYLNGSCVRMPDLANFNHLIQEYGDNLTASLEKISNNCDCENRLIEILCRVFLPNFSISNENSCNASACTEQLQIQRPCSYYCSNVTSRYYSSISDVSTVIQTFFGKWRSSSQAATCPLEIMEILQVPFSPAGQLKLCKGLGLIAPRIVSMTAVRFSATTKSIN